MRRFMVLLLVFFVFLLQDVEGGHRARRHHCPRKRLWTNMLHSCNVDDDCRDDECCCELHGLGLYCLPEEFDDKEKEDDSEKTGSDKESDMQSGSNQLYKEENDDDDCKKNKSWDKMKKCRHVIIGKLVFGVTVTISVTVLTCILILCIAKKCCKKKHTVSSAMVNLNINKLPKNGIDIVVYPDDHWEGGPKNGSTEKSLKEMEANETWAQRVLSFPGDQQQPPVYTPTAPPKYDNAPPPSYHI